MATRSSSNQRKKGQATARESTLRDRQSAAFDGRSTNVQPAGRNYKDNTQAVRRIPGVDYGEQQALTEQQQAAPLPKDSTPQAQAAPKRQFQPVDVFAQTQVPNQPITDGAPVGPGRMGMTLTPQQKGDLYAIALAELFPTSDTVSLANDGLTVLETE